MVTTLEAALQRIEELQQELQDERHRHDRYVDFELAQAEELRKLKDQTRWIPVDSGDGKVAGIWCGSAGIHRGSAGDNEPLRKPPC